jgi:hypothetical protein
LVFIPASFASLENEFIEFKNNKVTIEICILFKEKCAMTKPPESAFAVYSKNYPKSLLSNMTLQEARQRNLVLVFF